MVGGLLYEVRRDRIGWASGDNGYGKVDQSIVQQTFRLEPQIMGAMR